MRWIRRWRERRAERHRRMVGIWEGRVCRFCGGAYAEQPMCDIVTHRGKPCDFRVGK